MRDKNPICKQNDCLQLLTCPGNTWVEAFVSDDYFFLKASFSNAVL
jgi:hypothetical protein